MPPRVTGASAAPLARDMVWAVRSLVIYRSPQLCAGYWGKPQESEEAFRGGWFHSGDLVRIDDEGYLFVVDRIKDVINTGGVLVAVVATTEPVGADELTAFAREQLPGHKVPKSIHFVDALPK